MQPTMPSNVERGQRGQCARVLADAFTDDAIWNELRPRSTRRAGSVLLAPVAWTPGDRVVLR
ncbi:hypothetical protein [Nocardia salmonicida]|uniref:hypothetical protein n=1 Tax=Nocardia salmonicida TaxID=53431 RepID=UPI003CF88A6A